MNFERIYLDNAATTALRAEAADAMHAVSEQSGYNASSLHAEGRRARAALDAARDAVAAALGAARNEIVFTAGGTEADNLALLGAARAFARPGHVLAGAAEHHAVLGALERLAAEGWTTSLVPVDSAGRVTADAFAAALIPGTVLASVMYANNEIGTVAPIAELAAVAKRRGALFHCDAIQAPSWLPLDVGELGVDLLSLSAHKFGGPKGIGALYVRRGVALAPILYGGGQEGGRRPGTENVAAAAGMARALQLATSERPLAAARAAELRDALERVIRADIPDVRINGAPARRLPNVLSVSFAGVDAAALLIALDLAGIAASAGSACTSGALEPSHVLAAIGTDPEWRTGAVRFSLGVSTSSADIERVVGVLPGLVAQLRGAVPA